MPVISGFGGDLRTGFAGSVVEIHNEPPAAFES
jgi:hypothetical protein